MPYDKAQSSTWNPGDLGDAGAPDYGYWWQYPQIDIDAAMTPLIDRIRDYDKLRVRLEKKGGRLFDLPMITSLLTAPVSVETRFETYKVALVNQNTLKQALRDIHWDIRICVRQLPTQMPIYYICRIRQDYWSEYSLIVEDYYRSPGFSFGDERFVKMMQGGHENYFLRLAAFRDDARGLLQDEKTRDRRTVDRLLYDIGRYVLQSAWHDDQRLGRLTAEYFNLPMFFMAIELLYLQLTGELCELRSALTDQLLVFFETVYPQPAIRYFLEILSLLDGDRLNDLPVRAVPLYRRLSLAFSRFLSTDVRWGAAGRSLPLWKVVYSNFGRLKLISSTTKKDSALISASSELEAAAVGVIEKALCGPVTEDRELVDRIHQYFRNQ
jgi:hypothetical protein